MGLFWKFDCISEGLISSVPVPTTGNSIANENRDPEGLSILGSHSNLRGDTSLQCSGNKESNGLKGEWIAKCISSKTLLDVNGRVLSVQEARLATTWRTHHAFSARCGLAVSQTTIYSPPRTPHTPAGIPKQTETPEDSTQTCGQALPFRGTPPWMLRDARFYRAWKIDVYIRSTCADPHILLSVAPHYFVYGYGNGVALNGKSGPHPPTGQNGDNENALPWPSSVEDKIAYDKRMLETPLVYEEPYAVSAAFGSKGIHLWSDHWVRHGERVSSHRLEPFFSKEDSFLQSFSPLSFIQFSSDQEGGVSGEGITRNGSSTEGTPLGYQGFVRLQWSTPDPCSDAQMDDTLVATLSVFVGETRHRDSQKGDLGTHRDAANSSKNNLGIDSNDIKWQHAFDRTLQLGPETSNLLFVPYVTLLDSGSEVLILN
ncbi:unnamed protein product [Phytomonas sp. Hart1]|nr:unnamed protein product [Phytomonas sp. Hart1]|eukprot:CCW66601.1 unnamed protein product [Phytomonas sp. isolate Hart1]